MKRCTTSLSTLCVGALLCLSLLVSRTSGAEEVPVPARIQIPILLKILTFDRNFEDRVRSQLKIGILYTEEDPLSRQAKDDIVDVLTRYADKTIRRLPITYVLMRYTTEQNMAEFAKSQGINVFYVAPGNAKHLAALLRISQKHRIITVTGVPQYVERGVTVGLELKSDNKTRILINLKSSKMEGALFDANLLRLATVLRQ